MQISTHHNSTPPAKVAEWLAGQEPDDMTRAAELRVRSRGVGLEIRYEGRYPTDEHGNSLGSYQVAVGCRVHGNPVHREAALDDLRNFMTPAPMRAIEAWLAEMSVLVARKQDSDMADELRVEAFASRLSQYPADVARKATITKKPMWKFWPTWSEIERECERMSSPRRAMIAALERPPEPEEPKRRPATAEERARIAALIAEQFPAVSAQWQAAAVNELTKGNCMSDEEAKS